MLSSRWKAMLAAGMLGGIAVIFPSDWHHSRLSPSETAASPLEREGASGADKSSDQTVLPASLPGRQPLRETAPELFGAQSWQPEESKVEDARIAPMAPPLPYRFAGRLMIEGKGQVFLSKDDTAIPVAEGEILDGTYRVESITGERVTLVYLPLTSKISIAISHIAHGAAEVSTMRHETSSDSMGTIPTSNVIAPERSR
jgi:hypothetical protein